MMEYEEGEAIRIPIVKYESIDTHTMCMKKYNNSLHNSCLPGRKRRMDVVIGKQQQR